MGQPKAYIELAKKELPKMRISTDKSYTSPSNGNGFVLGHVADGRRYPLIVSHGHSEKIFRSDIYDIPCDLVWALTIEYDPYISKCVLGISEIPCVQAWKDLLRSRMTEY